MKKILSVLSCLLLMATITKAQVTNVDSKTCFCCNDLYNLVQPTIQGVTQVNCGTSATFTIPPCRTATINWSVTPSVAFTGQGSTSITLPTTTPQGTYTIKVTLSCAGKSVESKSLQLVVVGPKVCDPAFSFAYSTSATGALTITTTPSASTQVAGIEHWWGMQYNGTFPNCTNPCTAIPMSNFNTSSTGVWGGYISGTGALTPYKGSGITKGPSGYGISYTGFPLGTCIKITHYIKCCGVLYRQTQCVSFSLPTAAKGVNVKQEPKIEVGVIEMVPVGKEN
ncbi:MAG: hypothetical protein ACOVO1_10265 [Chitinophagaceae bacterium]